MQAAISDRESVLQMQLGNTQVNGWQKTRVQMDDSVEPLQQHWRSDFLWRTGDLEFNIKKKPKPFLVLRWVIVTRFKAPCQAIRYRALGRRFFNSRPQKSGNVSLCSFLPAHVVYVA